MVILLIVAAIIAVRGNEDNWIKDSRGVWVKHGNPANTPAEVTKQQDLIDQAMQIYSKVVDEKVNLDSGPCLGVIKSNQDWVVDIVHNPRTDADNLPDNQCEIYRRGEAHHFIELDALGNVIRVD